MKKIYIFIVVIILICITLIIFTSSNNKLDFYEFISYFKLTERILYNPKIEDVERIVIGGAVSFDIYDEYYKGVYIFNQKKK